MHYYDEWEEEKGGSVGEQVYYRVVQNSAYQSTESGLSLAAYEDYIARVHERYLSRPATATAASSSLKRS